jgi:hypothetical protein
VCNKLGINVTNNNFPQSYCVQTPGAIWQSTTLSSRTFEVNPRIFDFLEEALSDNSNSNFIVGKKRSEVAILFGAKTIVHEYIHILLSLNQVKLKTSNSETNSSIQSGFNVQKLKIGIQTEVLGTNTFDIDEGFTEFLAIYFIFIASNIENTKDNFEIFLQASSYTLQAKKIRDLAILLNDGSEDIKDEIIKLFLESKQNGSFQPIRKFIKDEFKHVLRANEIKCLDFSKVK